MPTSITDTSEKLAAIKEFVEKTHTQAQDLLKEAAKRENEENFEGFDYDEMADIEQWAAISNITSQLLDILNK